MMDLIEKTADMIEEILRERKGRKAGVSAGWLASRLNVDERTARGLVSHLIETRKLPIGSHPSYGFFWIQDDDDLEVACRHLRSRGVAVLRRMSILKKIPVDRVAVQLSLLADQE